MRHKLKPPALVCLLAVIIAGSAAGFEPGKIVNLGHCGSYTWSPDGARIACTHGQELRLYDTTGAQLTGCKLPEGVRDYVWGSDSTILFRSMVFTSSRSSDHAYGLLNLNNCEIETELSYEFIAGPRPVDGSSARPVTVTYGPTRTVEGAVCIEIERGDRRSIRIITPDSSLRDPSANHLVRVHDDNVYLVQCDEADSTLLAEKPFGFHQYLPTLVTENQRYIIHRSKIYDSRRDTLVDLQTVLKESERPENAPYCGFMHHTVDLNHGEVSMLVTCDDGESVVINRAAIYDINNGELTFLEDIPEIPAASTAAFSPDGEWLAVQGSEGLAIVRRGGGR